MHNFKFIDLCLLLLVLNFYTFIENTISKEKFCVHIYLHARVCASDVLQSPFYCYKTMVKVTRQMNVFQQFKE